MASREEAVHDDGLSSQTGDSHQNDKVASAADLQNKGLIRTSMREFEETAKPGKADGPSGDKISEDRKQRWARLLAKRPATKDGTSMSNWLMEVLAVSDLETPLKPPEADVPLDNNSNNNNNKSAGAPQDAAGESGSSLIVKKKRPVDYLSPKNTADGGEGGEQRSEPYAGGSFAEWKERKKQRKLSTKSDLTPTQQEQV